MKKPVKSSYLQKVFHQDVFKEMIREATREIKKFAKKTPFDALAFTGVSGAAIAFPLSITLNKPLICLRKNVKSSHFQELLEGHFLAKTYLFVDDCIASGWTVKRVFRTIKQKIKAEPVGIYLFDQNIITGNTQVSSFKEFAGVPVIISNHPWSTDSRRWARMEKG